LIFPITLLIFHLEFGIRETKKAKKKKKKEKGKENGSFVLI